MAIKYHCYYYKSIALVLFLREMFDYLCAMNAKTEPRRALSLAEATASKNLKRIYERNKKALRLTQSVLAKRYRTKDGNSITQGAVGHYINGNTPLNLWACNQFAELLQVDISEIAPEKILKEWETLSKDTVESNFFIVPHHCTTKNLAQEVNSERFRIFCSSHYGIDHTSLILVDVDNDSMSPLINIGDTLIVRRDLKVIESGSLYAIDSDGATWIRRIYRKKKNTLLLTVDGPHDGYEPEITTTGNLPPSKIIGKVWMRLGEIN